MNKRSYLKCNKSFFFLQSNHMIKFKWNMRKTTTLIWVSQQTIFTHALNSKQTDFSVSHRNNFKYRKIQ